MSAVAPFDFPAPFTQTLVVGEAHIDGLNHANNAVYVQWCESVAWSHSQALGLSLEDYGRLNRAMAIARAEYDYLKPALLGDSLTLCTWLTHSDGRLSMTRQFQLLRGNTTLMRGLWQLACIDMASGRPARMPVEFRDVYEPAIVEVSHV